MKRINFSHVWRYIKNRIPFFKTERSPYALLTTDNQLFNLRIKANMDCLRYSVQQFEQKMIGVGYQYNYFSFSERGQVSNVRRLYMDKGVLRQVHVRLFRDGSVSAHDEVAYEYDAINHKNGSTVRIISDDDRLFILDALVGV